MQKVIFSHALVEKENLSYQKIYNLEIFNRRATKIVEGEKLYGILPIFISNLAMPCYII